MPLQRFEAPTLEAALEEARTVAGPHSTVLEANRLRRGGVAGFFAKERYEVAVEVPDGAPAGPPDLLGLADAASRHDVIVPPTATPTPMPTAPSVARAPVMTDPTDEAAVSTERAAFNDLVARLARESAAAPAAPAAPSTPTPFLAAEINRPVTASHHGRLPQGERFGCVGLPESMALDPGLEPAHALLRALEALPAADPLPRGDGAVVAVVGDRDEALALARALADGLGLDPSTVALAAEDDSGEGLGIGCLLPTTMAVAEARCSARYRTGPSVVAIAVPVACNGGSWGRRVLEALDPTAVWAAVDAGRKPEDVQAWSDRLGGVDALAVSGLDSTTSPAAILAAGIPVAQLDGRPASPTLWTALLLERIAA